MLSIVVDSSHARRAIMRSLPRIAALVCLALGPALPAQVPSSADSTAAFFRRLIADRIAASLKRDTAAYHKFLDRDAVYVNDDGTRETADQHVRRIASRGIGHSTIDIDSVHVFRLGEFAMVDYSMIEHVPGGPRSMAFPGRSLDTFVERKGHWLVLGHAETHALAQPKPIVLDPAALDEYVGRYEWWPGYVDSVTRKGTQLFQQTTGEPFASANDAATAESFFEVGDASLMVFVRDKTGRVTGYILHWPDGQVTAARKLP
jgi:hypothetical protein